MVCVTGWNNSQIYRFSIWNFSVLYWKEWTWYFLTEIVWGVFVNISYFFTSVSKNTDHAFTVTSLTAFYIDSIKQINIFFHNVYREPSVRTKTNMHFSCINIMCIFLFILEIYDGLITFNSFTCPCMFFDRWYYCFNFKTM